MLRSPPPPGQQPRTIAETSRWVSASALVEIVSMWPSIRGSRGRSAMGHRDTRRGGGFKCQGPRRPATGGKALWRSGSASGGLWNARDALLVESHLLRDLLIRDAFDLAQTVDDQAGLDGVALKLLVLAQSGELVGRAV
jgi:hypothetical protein